MNRLEISDLSYCEALTEEDIKIDGGFAVIGLRLRRLRSFWLFLTPFKPDELDNFESTELATDSTSTITRLQNPTTGESGYKIISADGNSSSIVLSGPNSQSSFSIALS